MSTYHPSGPFPPDPPTAPAQSGYPPFPPPSEPPYPLYPPQVGGPAEHSPYGYPPAPVAAPDPLPAGGTEYHQFLRTGRNRWWKGVVAIAALVVGYLIVTVVLAIVATSIDLATGQQDAEALTQGRIKITPVILLATNLTNAALIPLAMLLQWLLWGQPIRWQHSVRGYFRFDLLKRTAPIIFAVFGIYVLATVFLFPSPPPGPFTAESVALLVVVLLTTPLQAAGEEYGARGLITRASGSWVADPRIALLISTALSATVFCLAHAASDPWLIGYYFFFGVAMSIVVWRTGGLEVSALIHTVNNLLLFTVAIVMGQDLAAGLDRSDGAGGPWVLVPTLVIAAVTAFVWWWARRHGVDRTSRTVH